MYQRVHWWRGARMDYRQEHTLGAVAFRLNSATTIPRVPHTMWRQIEGVEGRSVISPADDGTSQSLFPTSNLIGSEALTSNPLYDECVSLAERNQFLSSSDTGHGPTVSLLNAEVIGRIAGYNALAIVDPAAKNSKRKWSWHPLHVSGKYRLPRSRSSAGCMSELPAHRGPGSFRQTPL
jgi:hypothetical protein